MEKLTEQKIIRMMQREWNDKLKKLDEQLCEFMNVEDDDNKRGIVGVDTKVKHKGSYLLYTVHEIGPKDISLRTPEGKVFTISDSEFENEYELA